eukprot:11508846-Alexandrium_andersonii.AAC.1
MVLVPSGSHSGAADRHPDHGHSVTHQAKQISRHSRHAGSLPSSGRMCCDSATCADAWPA